MLKYSIESEILGKSSGCIISRKYLGYMILTIRCKCVSGVWDRVTYTCTLNKYTSTNTLGLERHKNVSPATPLNHWTPLCFPAMTSYFMDCFLIRSIMCFYTGLTIGEIE